MMIKYREDAGPFQVLCKFKIGCKICEWLRKGQKPDFRVTPLTCIIEPDISALATFQCLEREITLPCSVDLERLVSFFCTDKSGYHDLIFSTSNIIRRNCNFCLSAD